MRRFIVIFIVAVVAVALIGIYYSFNPAQCSLFPRCPFNLLTGYKCPGCGTQRAIHAMLNGDLHAAFGYNALMVASVPVMALYGCAELARSKYSRLYNAISSPPIIWSIFGIVVAWWLFRNIFNW